MTAEYDGGASGRSGPQQRRKASGRRRVRGHGCRTATRGGMHHNESEAADRIPRGCDDAEPRRGGSTSSTPSVSWTGWSTRREKRQPGWLDHDSLGSAGTSLPDRDIRLPPRPGTEVTGKHPTATRAVRRRLRPNMGSRRRNDDNPKNLRIQWGERHSVMQMDSRWRVNQCPPKDSNLRPAD